MSGTKIIIKPVEILEIILPKIDFEKTRHKGKNIFKILYFMWLRKLFHWGNDEIFQIYPVKQAKKING